MAAHPTPEALAPASCGAAAGAHASLLGGVASAAHGSISRLTISTP